MDICISKLMIESYYGLGWKGHLKITSLDLLAMLLLIFLQSESLLVWLKLFSP